MADTVIKTFTPLLGKRMRVTVLDECGAVSAPGAADSAIATDGFVTVSLSAEVEDGAEIVTKKANGAIYVNEKFASSFKRFTVSMEFAGVNPGLLSLVSNAKAYSDYAGDLAGFTVGEGLIDKKFALEVWTGVAGAQCVPGGDAAGGYLLLPFINGGNLGDLEINGTDAINFSLANAYTLGGNQWGVGPYDVVLNATPAPGAAAPLPEALDPFDHLLMLDTSVAPPPSADVFLAMPT